MKPSHRMMAIVASLSYFGCSSAAVEDVQSASENLTSCGLWDTYSVNNNEYVIQHNEWNSSRTECLTVTGSDFRISQDSQNLPTAGAPGSYPSIYKGCHWGKCTTNSGMPIQLSSITSAPSSWSVKLPTSGAYDVAYDIWINSTPTTSGQPDGTEIMIWLSSSGGVRPAGQNVGQVYLGGATWNVWYYRMNGWNYVAYQRTSGTTYVNFDLLPFFQDSIARGYTRSSHYLLDVEAGFEVWQGGTGLESTSFSVNVNGRPYLPPATIAPGYYELSAKFSGRCLTDMAWAPNNGAQIGQWDCGAGGDQQFYISPTGNGYYQLINMNSNRCLDVPGASTTQGVYLQLYDCNGTAAQNWMFVDVGGGYYQIVNQGSGMVVDVDQVNPNNGALIHQWSYLSGGNQQWALTPLRQTANVVTLKAAINGKYVCAENAGASPLIANRDVASTWESFYQVQATPTQVAFQSLADGYFVTADINTRNGQLIASGASRPLGWELFTLVPEPNNQWALVSAANGLYVSADNGGQGPLIANASTVSDPALFWIGPPGGGTSTNTGTGGAGGGTSTNTGTGGAGGGTSSGGNENLITDADFSGTYWDWSISAGYPTLPSPGVLCMNPVASSYSFGLGWPSAGNPGFQITAGKTYTLTFDAWATYPASSLSFKIGQAASPYNTFAQQSTAVNKATASYSLTFTATANAVGGLYFWANNTNNPVCITNVNLVAH